MKKRSIGLMILFTIITLGIYQIYWYIAFQCELKRETGEGFGGGMHFVMTIITLSIYRIYWNYVAGKRLNKLGASDMSIIYLVFCFLPVAFLNPFLMQNQANQLNK